MSNVQTDLVVVQGNLNAQRYVYLLNNNLLPFMQNFGPDLFFQHDNTRPDIALVNCSDKKKQICFIHRRCTFWHKIT